MAKQTYQNYMKEYFETKCKRINVVLYKGKDDDIIEYLEGKNIQATTKSLIREAMKSQ